MTEPVNIGVRRPALHTEVSALRLFEFGLCLRTAIQRDAGYHVREALEYEWHVYTKWEVEVAARFGNEMSIK
jgi:hypothetical protein